MQILSAMVTPEVRLELHKFSFFRSCLHVEGVSFATHQAVIEIFLEIAGQRHVMPRRNLPSPAETLKYGYVAAAAGFSGEIMVPPFAVAEARIGVLLADGEQVVRGVLESYPPSRLALMLEDFMRFVRARPQGAMLEIGSRQRIEANQLRRQLPVGWTYTGLDIVQDDNVDVVADAHECSRVLGHDRYDAIISLVVFEHLLMPWKVALEINQVMKVGGEGLIMAPQSWPLHELPNDYFRFSRHAWKALFNRYTGFEILAVEEEGDAEMVARTLVPASQFLPEHVGALMSAVRFRKTGPARLSWDVPLSAISDDVYPD